MTRGREDRDRIYGSSDYIYGCDLLGDAGTGGAPSLPLEPEEFGPGTGGTHYTDAPTIRAVQQALKDRGYSLGPGGVDGKFGPDTEAALYKFGGIHGPPDDAMLAKLGVKPGGVPAVARTSSGTYLPVAATSAPPSSSAAGFWQQPLWQGAPVKRWQAGVGAGGFFVVLVGLMAAVRR